MITNMAITQAKIGRWMKNFDMHALPGYLLAAAEAADVTSEAADAAGEADAAADAGTLAAEAAA